MTRRILLPTRRSLLAAASLAPFAGSVGRAFAQEHPSGAAPRWSA